MRYHVWVLMVELGLVRRLIMLVLLMILRELIVWASMKQRLSQRKVQVFVGTVSPSAVW